jgi:3-oxoacyl-[acyl-carrier-protein] synthase II
MAKRRVVITGIGLGTCLGVGTTRVWQRILKGESGLAVLGKGDRRFNAVPSIVGGTVPRGNDLGMLDEEEVASKYERQKYPSAVTLGLAVLEIALHNAGYSKKALENLPQSRKDRMGICTGLLPDFHDVTGLSSSLKTDGFHRLDLSSIFKLMSGSMGTAVSTRYGLQGPNTSAVTACTTGASVVGDSFRTIRDGYADFMLAGASQPFTFPSIAAGLLRANALCTRYQDAPQRASRPFDRDRSGTIPSEGAGAVVLEEYELAKARGAPIYCEVLGYGMSGDAYHVLAPRPDGLGPYNAMVAALRDAHQAPENISYVNAHAASTPAGDAVENSALVRLFGKTSRLAVSSTKSTTGHMFLAAGACETICTALSLYLRELPPTINLHNLDPPGDYPFNYVPNEAQQLICDGAPVALTNSFGMGGPCASLCLRGM